MIFKKILLMLMCWGGASCYALDADKPFNQYVLDAWSIEQGLPQISVHSLAQDDQGYIWVGTQAGLAKFDGVNFKTYSIEDTPELTGNFIQSLYNDSQSRLWIGTYKGLVKYAKGQFKAIQYFPGPNQEPMSLNIYQVIENNRGDVWVAAVQGLFRFDARNQVLIRENTQPTYSLFAANQSLLLGEVGQFSFLEKKRTTTVKLPEVFSDARITRMIKVGEVILAGTTQGLLEIDINQLSVKVVFKNTPIYKHPVDSLYQDSDKNVWVGTIKGLFRIREGQVVEHVGNDNNHNFQQIQTIIEDHEKNLWVGSYRDGVARIWSGRISRYSVDVGLNEPLVWSILPDTNNDNIFVGTNQGLSIFNGQAIIPVASSDELTHPTAYTLFQEGEDLWVGSRAGVSLLKQGKVVPVKFSETLSTLQVNSIYRIKQSGRLLMGTTNGLYEYNEAELKPLLTTKGQKLFVRPIAELMDGKVLVGTQNGLYQLIADELIPYGLSTGLPAGIDVTGILELNDNQIVISTIANGLFILVNQRWVNITERDGLPVNESFTVLRDDLGYLWVSGFKGLYRISIKNMLSYINGNSDTISSYMFLSESGGLLGSQKAYCCNGAGNAKGFIKNGMLWYPTRDGIVKLNTNQIKLNSVLPNVIIERVKKHNRWVNVDENFNSTFAPDERDLSFDFTALSFRDPKSVLFKYRLLGYHDDWRTPEDRLQRRVNYTNLSPGKYVLQVMAANNAGKWNPQIAELNFEILPNFYETYWFYSSAFILMIFMVYAWHQQRTRSLKLKKIELENEIKRHTQQLEVSNQKLHQAVQALEEISQTDQLTGLKNRRYLASQMPADLAHFQRQLTAEQPGEKMVFAIADIDHFKNINDTYGHKAGDDVLHKFAAVIKGQIREGDYAVRWGGEEFIIVFRPMPSKMTTVIIERIRAAIEATEFAIDGGKVISLTCSIGFVSYPFFSDDISKLSWEHTVELADHALYLTKENGRNGWACFRATETTPHSKDLLFKVKDNLADELAHGRLQQITSWGESN
ncbi:ligand-binding sensor domain-containing protein [Aliikangiella sp. IMCC44632]